MKIEDNFIFLADVNSMQHSVIRSWGMMRWDRTNQWYWAQITLDLLNRIGKLVPLPASVEETRKQLYNLQASIDRQRMDEDPEPLYDYPVKIPLFKHQMRGANMALLAFGLIEPEEVPQKPQDPQDPGESAMDALNRFFDYLDGNENAFKEKECTNKHL